MEFRLGVDRTVVAWAGALLAGGGFLVTTAMVLLEDGYRVTLTASADGKVSGHYETDKVFGHTSVDIPPGAVRGASVETEWVRTTETDTAGRRHAADEEVSLLRLDWDARTRTFYRDDAPALAKRIQELPKSPAGTRVDFEVPLPVSRMIFSAGVAVAGVVILLFARFALAPAGARPFGRA